VAGASNYFKGSIVSYATQTKIDLLKISNETILKYGVVSEIVAKEMAISVKEIMNTDYAIATTGNAGPTVSDGKAAIGTVL